MYSPEFRAVRATTGFILIALAACADEPAAPDLKPNFGVGDVIMVTNLSGGNNVGSLRWAVSQITGGEIIQFAPGLAGQTITLDSSVTALGKPFTLEGPARQGITISGGGQVRVFWVDPGGAGNEIVLRNLTIAHGKASSGAGIAVPVTSRGSVRVENSTLTGNVANVWAAISTDKAILVNTTVSGNTNLLTSSPTPVVAADVLELVNSTVAHNEGEGVGAINLTMANSIIAHHAGQRNCSTTPFMTGNVSISNDASCGSTPGVMLGDPKLGPLSNNGGGSMTHALLAGSPAINAASNCSVTVDQRYTPRDAQCDVGAFEFTDFTTVALTVSASATFDTNGWATLSGTVRCSRNDALDLQFDLRQLQKSGKDTAEVHAVAILPVACSTTVQSWSVALGATHGPFENGDAVATVSTSHAQPWVTPASVSQSVRLFKARR